MRASILVAISSTLVAMACGGSVEPLPGPSPSSPSGAATGTKPGGSTGGQRGNKATACGAVPRCEAGDLEVKSESLCRQDGYCYSRTLCGLTIWCTNDAVTCDGYPVCPAGSQEVSSCPTDTDCSSVTVCGATIYCLEGCEGPQPICDAGHTQVSGPSACLQDDAVCYSRSVCGTTIWCTGPDGG